MTPHREQGFTLVEMLVALLIFGMLTAAGVSLLSFSVRAQEASDRSLGDLSQLRRTAALMTADFAQATPRIYRDERGGVQRAFGGSGAGQPTVAFVRRGWENYDGAARSELQRVEYRLNGDRLERLHHRHVDGATPQAPALLATGVRSLSFRFRGVDGGWRERWDPENPAELPRAVELVVDTPRFGSLRQLFLVGVG